MPMPCATATWHTASASAHTHADAVCHVAVAAAAAILCPSAQHKALRAGEEWVFSRELQGAAWHRAQPQGTCVCEMTNVVTSFHILRVFGSCVRCRLGALHGGLFH